MTENILMKKDDRGHIGFRGRIAIHAYIYLHLYIKFILRISSTVNALTLGSLVKQLFFEKFKIL